jgi:hypothetical protein
MKGMTPTTPCLVEIAGLLNRNLKFVKRQSAETSEPERLCTIPIALYLSGIGRDGHHVVSFVQFPGLLLEMQQ